MDGSGDLKSNQFLPSITYLGSDDDKPTSYATRNFYAIHTTEAFQLLDQQLDRLIKGSILYRVFLHRMRRPFFKYQKNYLLQNIVIDLILKTVHWTMFSLNAIGLEKTFLNEIVQSEKKNFHFNFLIFQFTRERIKLSKRF